MKNEYVSSLNLLIFRIRISIHYSLFSELDETFLKHVYPVYLCASLMASPIFVFSQQTTDYVEYLANILRSNDNIDVTSKPVTINLTYAILFIIVLQCNFGSSAIQLVKMSYAESYILLKKGIDYPDIIGILTESLNMTVKENNPTMILETILHKKNLCKCKNLK